MPATLESLTLPGPSLAQYWLTPLFFFHERRGLKFPRVHFIPGPSTPEPQRSLLVQENDMTPVLTAFHRSPLQLEVLDREMGEQYLIRLVNLRRQDNLMVVECGAIGIQLSRFPKRVRTRIEEGRFPLGDILQQEKVAHRGRPRGFFEVSADNLVAHALGESKGSVLYGRCNELSFLDGLSFANVVEILPASSFR
jgi:chorismate-pyruvate lyase